MYLAIKRIGDQAFSRDAGKGVRGVLLHDGKFYDMELELCTAQPPEMKLVGSSLEVYNLAERVIFGTNCETNACKVRKELAYGPNKAQAFAMRSIIVPLGLTKRAGTSITSVASACH